LLLGFGSGEDGTRTHDLLTASQHSISLFSLVYVNIQHK